MKQQLRYQLLWPVPALALFGFLSWHFWFTQDDAFITFRYVGNLLNGHGLVYNIGERVEGYTNFGWAILLALIGRTGLDFLLASKLIGMLCGAGTILVTGMLARRLSSNENWLLPAFASLLAAANGSLSYWSQAGLETGAFTLCLTLSAYLYIVRSRMLGWILLLAALLRPEGGLLVAFFLVAAIFDRDRRQLALGSALLAIFFYLPVEIFRLTYYGSILPNPFYAKTSFDLQQLQAGLAYAWEFLLNYGLCGLPLMVLLVLWRKLSLELRLVTIGVIGWVIFVTIGGGDVLKINRFYVPVAGLFALLTVVAVERVTEKIDRFAQQIRAGLVVAAAALTLLIPYSNMRAVLQNEIGLVDSMTGLAKSIAWLDKTDYSLAATTIGALGYYSDDHRVIDMLGLTDSTIARHPLPISGSLSTSWRERKYNARYIIDQAPKYIVFSTSARPSAPAEQALLLQPTFLSDYRITTLPAFSLKGIVSGFRVVYREIRHTAAPENLTLPVEFVSQYKLGLEAMDQEKFQEAIDRFEQAEKVSESFGSYPEMLYFKANCLMHLERNLEAYQLLNAILVADSFVLGPHRDLYPLETRLGDMRKAAIHRNYVQMFNPIEAMMLDSVVVGLK